MSINIRSIKTDDIEFIVNSEIKYFNNNTSRQALELELINPLIKYIVIEDKVNIGYISLWIDEDKAQINSFLIVTEYRKKGYGRRLLGEALKVLEDLGVIEVTLEVRPSNEEALSLYISHGFKQVAVRKAYYGNGEDALLMYKRLGSD
jgi:ribosomal-protein-alanine N-acetyltransferase